MRIRPAVWLSLVLAVPAAADPAREQRLRAHLEFLASDALNGRAGGSRDELIAALYAASVLRQAGVEPAGDDGGFLQRVELVRHEASAPPRLVVDGGVLQWTHGKQVSVWRMTGPLIEGPLQKLSGDAAVKPGAVVWLAEGGSRAGLSEARRLLRSGAAAVLVPESNAQRASAGFRLPARLKSEPAPASSALVALGAEAQAALARVAEGAPVRLEMDVGPEQVAATWNVVGRLTGADPAASREALLLSAHIDHLGARESGEGDRVFNGADDDASGVAAVLELARALAEGPRPRRTVLFALFGSEESGGFGSRRFLEDPPLPLSALVANLQFEMLGRPDPKLPARTLWLAGFDRSDLGSALAAHGAPLQADPRPEQNFFERSDNIGLARRGVVAHSVSSFGLHADYHQVTDEVARIDFAHLAEAVGALVRPVTWLANDGFRPAWAPGKRPPPIGRAE
jgi:aminopeptidase YwaD